jgi:O-methyltransferase
LLQHRGTVGSGDMTDQVRRLYTDLLIRTLTNTIYGDPAMDPWHDKRFDPALRETGEDWPLQAHSMVGIARLENLRDLTQAVIDDDIPGDFIETGVWRGGCCILMRGVLAANAVTDRRIFVADSFDGLPPPNAAYPKDADDQLFKHRELAVSVAEVQTNFRAYGLLDECVVFVKGLFQDTLAGLETGPLALIRLDGDMYESTIVALTALYPRVSPGGFVIIDDYGAIEACRAAVTDYRAQHGIEAPIHRIDWAGVWWRKPFR